jgi:hypothetical protein
MPIVQPGQINLQQFQPQAPVPSFGERLFKGLGSGVQGIIAAMQEREKLEREKQEFESKQAYFKTLREGNELENEQKRSGLKKEQRQLEAKGQGLDAYTQWVGGGARQEGLGAIIARIKDPDTAQDFVDRVTKHRQQENEAALAAQNAAQAEVETATKGAKIRNAEATATTAEVNADVETQTKAEQIAQPKADLAYKRALTAQATPQPNAGLDPQVGNAMMTMWKAGGITRADAAKMYGVTLPTGLDPNEKAPTPGGMGAADKRRNEVTTLTSKASDRVINELTNKGVRISRLTPLVAGTKLGEMSISEDEQQLLQANRQFAQMYGLFVTGQASSEPELQRILKTVVPSAGDKPGVLQQKAIMRQVIVQAMESAYGQGRPAGDVLREAAENARGMGVPTKDVLFLQNSSMDAHNAELKTERDRARSPIFAPLTGGNPMDYDSVMGGYNFNGQAK